MKLDDIIKNEIPCCCLEIGIICNSMDNAYNISKMYKKYRGGINHESGRRYIFVFGGKDEKQLLSRLYGHRFDIAISQQVFNDEIINYLNLISKRVIIGFEV